MTGVNGNLGYAVVAMKALGSAQHFMALHGADHVVVCFILAWFTRGDHCFRLPLVSPHVDGGVLA